MERALGKASYLNSVQRDTQRTKPATDVKPMASYPNPTRTSCRALSRHRRWNRTGPSVWLMTSLNHNHHLNHHHTRHHHLAPSTLHQSSGTRSTVACEQTPMHTAMRTLHRQAVVEAHSAAIPPQKILKRVQSPSPALLPIFESRVPLAPTPEYKHRTQGHYNPMPVPSPKQTSCTVEPAYCVQRNPSAHSMLLAGIGYLIRSTMHSALRVEHMVLRPTHGTVPVAHCLLRTEPSVQRTHWAQNTWCRTRRTAYIARLHRAYRTSYSHTQLCLQHTVHPSVIQRAMYSPTCDTQRTYSTSNHGLLVQ